MPDSLKTQFHRIDLAVSDYWQFNSALPSGFDTNPAISYGLGNGILTAATLSNAEKKGWDMTGFKRAFRSYHNQGNKGQLTAEEAKNYFEWIGAPWGSLDKEKPKATPTSNLRFRNVEAKKSTD